MRAGEPNASKRAIIPSIRRFFKSTKRPRLAVRLKQDTLIAFTLNENDSRWVKMSGVIGSRMSLSTIVSRKVPCFMARGDETRGCCETRKRMHHMRTNRAHGLKSCFFVVR